MIRLILALSCLLMLGPHKAAADEQQLALAREVLAAGDPTQVFERSFMQMVEPLVKQIGEINPDQAVKVRQTLEEMVSDVRREMVEKLAPLLVRDLSREELIKVRDFNRTRTAFFQSDTGKKLVGIVSPSNEVFLDITTKYQQKLIALLVMVQAGMEPDSPR
jgi:hypothetical protein